jgi:hypothetical protein
MELLEQSTLRIADGDEALLLRFHQKLWAVVFESQEKHFELQPESRLEPPSLESAVEQAEKLQTVFSFLHPVFTFDADILFPLSHMAALTRNPNLLRRIVAILKALNRREGIWDSKELAEILEAALIAQEDPTWPDTSFFDGILGLTRALASAKIPGLSPTNSIVLLAQATTL